MKRLLTFFILASMVLFSAEDVPCRIDTAVSLATGGNGIRMENGKVALVLNPNLGGTGIQLTDLQNGIGWTPGSSEVQLFGDRILEVGWNTVLNLPFAWQVLDNTPDKISVELRREGIPQYQYLIITRVITMTRGSGTIEIAEKFTNDPAGMAPLVITPYFRQGLAIPGAETFFYVPAENGIRQNSNKQGGGDCFSRDAVAGFAAVGDGKGNGLSFEYDFSHLSYVYNWISGLDKSTLEWVFLPVRIESGSSFETRYSITPFHGIVSPQGAKNGMTATVEKGRLRVYSDKAIDGSICFNGKDAGKATLKPNVVTEIPVALPANGIADISIESGGKQLFRMAVPMSDGAKVPPECSKVKAAEQIIQELKLSCAIETPHVPWSRPLRGGKLKLLVLCDYQQQREAVELMERLDCEVSVIRISHISSQMSWGMVDHFGSFNYKDANSALRHELKKEFDAVIVSGNLLSFVESDNLKAIRGKLESGAGLILIQPYAVPRSFADLLLMRSSSRPTTLHGEWIPAKHPLASGWTPELSQPGQQCSSELLPGAQTVIASIEGPVFAAGTPKGIRVVQASYFAAGALLPVFPLEAELNDYNHLDYQFVPLIKSILWVAKRLPEQKIRVERLMDQITIHAESPTEGTLELTQRNLFTGKCQTKTVSLSGKKDLNIPADNVPGVHTAEYRLIENGCVLNFGFAALEIASPVKILDMETDKELYSAGDTISGKLSLSSSAQKVAIELTDAEGRLLARTNAEQGAFALVLPEASTRMMTISATAFQDGIPQVRKRHTIYARVQRPVSDYAISGSEHEWMWDINRKLRPFFFRELRKQTGYDLMRLWTFLSKDRGIPAFKDYMRFDFPWNVSILTDFRLRDFAERFQKPYHQTGDRKYLERSPCFHDPAWIKRRNDMITSTLELSKNYTPVQFSYGDEVSLTHFGREHDFCFSSYTLAAYRKHLQTMYGSINALNAQWGTQYMDWNSIVPPLTPDAQKAGKETGNYSAWFDFRDFMDLTFSSLFAESTQVARSAGHLQPVDLSGIDSGNAFNGKQWYRMDKVLDQVAPYISSDIGDQIRSHFHGSVIPWNAGYSSAGPIVAYQVWRDALMFRRGGSSFYSTRNTLYPDYTIQPGTKDWADATRDLRNGLGALRATLDEEPPELLILQSQSSMLAATILGKAEAFKDARIAWSLLAVDLDLRFRYVAEQEVEAGLLQKTTARVVVLPLARALSPEVCHELRQFVERGGILVADRLPALMDNHGKTLPKAQLDDLFGLASPDMEGEADAMVELDGRQCQRKIGSASGKDGRRYAISNNVAKGRTVFLNFMFSGYTGLRSNYEKGKDEIIAMQKAFLSIIGGRQQQSYVATVDGGMPPRARFFSYRQPNAKEALFLGAIRENTAKGDCKVTFTFQKAGYLYDMRKGTVSSAPVSTWSTKLQPAQALFLALLPEKIQPFQLKASAEILQGERFSYDVALPQETALEHVYEITVIGPDGEKRRLYSQIAHAPGGSFHGSFLTALNEQCGKWILSVRNVINGYKREYNFVIKDTK